ncbi:hypothetical protein SELMODRAFT_426588 [Selaginella moellendorffii]|uniref:Uncharacterized protein n=1 Tax=Selaginella moellendorffii TaxID=88036 RepID=D8SWV3_SELML|nr:hypothetical protein SELMODRAFT_426588 [Selaginella moellendorffii]
MASRGTSGTPGVRAAEMSIVASRTAEKKGIPWRSKSLIRKKLEQRRSWLRTSRSCIPSIIYRSFTLIPTATFAGSKYDGFQYSPFLAVAQHKEKRRLLMASSKGTARMRMANIQDFTFDIVLRMWSSGKRGATVKRNQPERRGKFNQGKVANPREHPGLGMKDSSSF